MGGLYHFTRLVQKYAKQNAPVRVTDGKSRRALRAVVLSEKEELEPGPGGMRNRAGRELVCCERLEALFEGAAALQSLRVEVEGELYAVLEERGYEGFADLYLYRLHKLNVAGRGIGDGS